MSALVVREVTRYAGPYPYVDGLIMQVTQRIDSIEVKHFARAEGRSQLHAASRLVRLWLNLATNFSLLPLRLAVFAGVAMGFLGLMAALFVIIEALMGETPSGWASTMTVDAAALRRAVPDPRRAGRVCRPRLPVGQRQAPGRGARRGRAPDPATVAARSGAARRDALTGWRWRPPSAPRSPARCC